jgi:hypothetical protein
LSCVNAIIAFGGKREKGARKEKRAWMPVFGAAGEVVAVEWEECEDRRERKVKNTEVTKKATMITILGGRMLCKRCS